MQRKQPDRRIIALGHLGAPAGTLPNDSDGGVIGQDQYNTWKANYGMSTAGSGSVSDATVPEPATGLLLFTASLILWGRFRAF